LYVDDFFIFYNDNVEVENLKKNNTYEGEWAVLCFSQFIPGGRVM
jgi:hypothetical protein